MVKLAQYAWIEPNQFLCYKCFRQFP